MRICFINLVSTTLVQAGTLPLYLLLFFTKTIINKSVPGVMLYSVAMETGTINACVNRNMNEVNK